MDPLGLGGEPNEYDYARNNTLAFVDPSGMLVASDLAGMVEIVPRKGPRHKYDPPTSHPKPPKDWKHPPEDCVFLIHAGHFAPNEPWNDELARTLKRVKEHYISQWGMIPPNYEFGGVGCQPKTLEEFIEELFPGQGIPGTNPGGKDKGLPADESACKQAKIVYDAAVSRIPALCARTNCKVVIIKFICTRIMMTVMRKHCRKYLHWCSTSQTPPRLKGPFPTKFKCPKKAQAGGAPEGGQVESSAEDSREDD